jgi:hypothetical protein
MALPTPEQFRQLIISEDDAVCDQLRKLSTTTKLISDVYAEIFNTDGSLTAEFLAKVCALDCTGSGGTGTTSTTSSTSTTGAPVSVVQPDIFTFQTALDGSSLKSTLKRFSGASFDSIKYFPSYLTSVDVASNKVVVAAALHPGNGTLYVVVMDGAPASSYPLSLGTVDTATGAVTVIGALGVTMASGSHYGLSFKPSDNTLWLMVSSSETILYTLNLSTGAKTTEKKVSPFSLAPAPDGNLHETGFIIDHDSTPYYLGRYSADGLYRVSTHSFTARVDAYSDYYADHVSSASIASLQSPSANIRVLPMIRNNEVFGVSLGTANNANSGVSGAPKTLFATDVSLADLSSPSSPNWQHRQTLSALPGLECIAHLAT